MPARPIDDDAMLWTRDYVSLRDRLGYRIVRLWNGATVARVATRESARAVLALLARRRPPYARWGGRV